MAQAQHQTTGKTPLTNLAGADLLPLVFVNETAALVPASLPKSLGMHSCRISSNCVY